jgi:hypothetical protein
MIHPLEIARATLFIFSWAGSREIGVFGDPGYNLPAQTLTLVARPRVEPLEDFLDSTKPSCRSDLTKFNNPIIRLALLILPLALLAAGAGVFGQGTGEPYPFTTLRGETVMIRGHGLYRFDTIAASSQEVGQDIVTLVIGLPLLVIGMFLSRRGSLRGRLLLTGVFGYFLYTYTSMSFLTAFNSLFLVYVALFSLSLFGFILALAGLEPEQIASHISDRFPCRTIATYFIVVAAFLAFAWLGLVVPPMFTGKPPAGIESAITLVIQVLDLGVIVPTSVFTAILLLKRQPWGYTLSTVILLKILTMGAALISMIIVQMLAGVAVDPAISITFGLISVTGIVLAIVTLRAIQD